MTEVISTQPDEPKRKPAGRAPKPVELIRPKPAIIPEARLLDVATEYLCGHYHRNPEKLKQAAYADPDFTSNLRDVHARELLPAVKLALHCDQFVQNQNNDQPRTMHDLSDDRVPFNRLYRLALYADHLYMETRATHEWAFLSKSEQEDRTVSKSKAIEEIAWAEKRKGGFMFQHEWFVEAAMRLDSGDRYPQLVPEEMDALSMDDGEDEL